MYLINSLLAAPSTGGAEILTPIASGVISVARVSLAPGLARIFKHVSPCLLMKRAVSVSIFSTIAEAAFGTLIKKILNTDY